MKKILLLAAALLVALPGCWWRRGCEPCEKPCETSCDRDGWERNEERKQPRKRMMKNNMMDE
ncbi:MAG: hypothetical protein WA432_02720 [Candidatus Babeliaceae bacterium]